MLNSINLNNKEQNSISITQMKTQNNNIFSQMISQSKQKKKNVHPLLKQLSTKHDSTTVFK